MEIRGCFKEDMTITKIPRNRGLLVIKDRLNKDAQKRLPAPIPVRPGDPATPPGPPQGVAGSEGRSLVWTPPIPARTRISAAPSGPPQGVAGSEGRPEAPDSPKIIVTIKMKCMLEQHTKNLVNKQTQAIKERTQEDTEQVTKGIMIPKGTGYQVHLLQFTLIAHMTSIALEESCFESNTMPLPIRCVDASNK